MTPWRVALFAACFAVATLVGLARAFAGDATYEQIATREDIARELFRAPACDAPGCSVEATTYPLATLVRLHHDTLAYVTGSAPAVPASPTRGAFYTDDEIAHLADVRRVFIGAEIAALAALIVLAVLLIRAARRGIAGALARNGAIASAIAVMLVAAFAAASFDAAFTIFHDVFFPQGNWSFGPGSNMLKLYPEPYWYGVTLRIAVSFLAIATLVAALGEISARRSRRAAAPPGTAPRSRSRG